MLRVALALACSSVACGSVKDNPVVDAGDDRDAGVDAAIDANPNACPPGGLVSRDHPSLGANALTLDTTSKLAWLDLTQTVGLSHAATASRMAPGQTFEGFRFATRAEVEALFANAGLAGVAAADYTPAMTLQTLVGLTRPNFGSADDTVGYTGTQAGTDRVGCLLRTQRNPQEGSFQCGFVNSDTSSDPVIGHWVVLAAPGCE